MFLLRSAVPFCLPVFIGLCQKKTLGALCIDINGVTIYSFLSIALSNGPYGSPHLD
ncbi:unnamed protein product [Sphenostylis stenocarpa]|uniref:Uncharacterized protein n=1 Tax=Sphenostylis stenocarpa TaxID=92480 RepID=A0AA86VIC8_9FABA|nr:unnamed protein product [Sphenostylis stenocarpa]